MARKKLLALMMVLVLCVGLIAMPVQAASKEAVSVEVSADMDKNGEDIVELEIEVVNDNNHDIRDFEVVEVFADGYKFVQIDPDDGKIDRLEAGDSASLELDVEVRQALGLIWIILICVAGLVLIAGAVVVILIVKKKKNAKNITAVLLLVVFLLPLALQIPALAADDFVNNEVTATADLIIDGQEIELSIRTKYAVYDEDRVPEFTVSFESNGGTKVDTVVVVEGEKLAEPEIPEKEDCLFAGWYTDKDCTQRYLFGLAPVDKDMTLYADWVTGDADAMLASYVAQAVAIQFQPGDSVDHVTQDVGLPTSLEGEENVQITWTSSSETVTSEGVVTRPEGEDEVVTLSVEVKVNDASHQVDHTLTVMRAHERNPEDIVNSSVIDIENMNEGQEFDISYNEGKTQVVSIDGKYSDIIVGNADDALDVVQGVHSIVGIDDAYEELEALTSNRDEYGCEYTFGQVYNGYEVYGRRITVSADADGVTDSLGAGLYSTDKLEDLYTYTYYSEEEAMEIALEHFGGECQVDENMTTFVYYTLGEYEEYPVLAYRVYVAGTDSEGETVYASVFVDSEDGDVVYVNTESTGASISTGTAASETADRVEFPVSFTWDKGYYMQDLERNIRIYTASGTFSATAVGSEYNDWSDPTAVSAYINTIKTYDWYKDVLGRNSLDGNGFALSVIVHNPFYTDNAFWNGSSRTLNFCDNSSGGMPTTAGALDVVAHEYTHGVVQFVTGGLPYKNAPGAINEGYADIFACLVDGDWEIGEDWMTIRDASDPTKYNAPDKMSSEHYVDYTTTSWDNGGVHVNSSLLYHAAYLMSEAGMDNDTLAKLWYKSLSLGYSGSSTFETVRRNVLKAAQKIRLPEEQIIIIRNAFDQVEIFGARGTYEGVVTDLEGNKLAGVEVGIYHNDALVQTVTTDAEGCFSVILDKGDYSVRVAHADYVAYNAEISIAENEVTEVEIILVKAGMASVNGVVVSATSALSLEGVLINVRAGVNVREGVVLQMTTTDATGSYLMELEAGYYTFEMILENYTTGYVNVLVSAGSEIVANGSLSPIMTSSNYRVVLTWGADPRDLDSHLEAETEDGMFYHVYYGNKSAYEDSEQIANLDVDDTSGYGPETTTFLVETGGSYEFRVHKYSGYGSLADSGATVEVYNGDTLVAKFIINSAGDDSCYDWNVFAIENGIFRAVNTLT